ncbi:MAG: AraC family transcriptional regulator [Nitrospira sp. WS110]|nr:AraC family transcriptional regulator [Nitrospira sp. WS110]
MKRHRTPTQHQPRTIALLGFDGVAALDITGPYEVFSLPSYLAQDKTVPPYRIVLIADRPGPVRSASGLSLIADTSWRNFHDKVDTLLVCGGPEMNPQQSNRQLLAWLRTMSRRTRRIGSICTGAFLLAEAGLLKNRRATTHWREVTRLAQEYQSTTVEPDAIYVKDGHVYTSAGITAGMDLALALVEEDLGRDVALAVARMLVLFLKRPGGQSQFSTQLQAQAVEGQRLASLLSWLADHHHESLTVEKMASQAGMSPRTFARVFVAETGDTPALYLEKLRLEHAVRLLETTGTSLDMTAQACGFTGHEQLRRAFQRHKGITPQDYQKRFQTTKTISPGGLS